MYTCVRALQILSRATHTKGWTINGIVLLVFHGGARPCSVTATAFADTTVVPTPTPAPISGAAPDPQATAAAAAAHGAPRDGGH